MKKRVFITGASGFIGQHLVRHLCASGQYEIYALSRLNVPFTHENVVWVVSPIEELSKRFPEITSLSFDVLYHLAAFIPKKAEEANDIESNINQNIITTKNLYETLHAKKIIFASTIDVYSVQSQLPVAESSALTSENLYGISKIMAEAMTRIHATANGVPFAMLRIGHVYGPGEEKYGKIIPVLIRNSLEGKTTTIRGDGSVRRDFVYVGDLCRILENFIETNFSSPVNIVTGQAHTLREIAEILNDITGGKTQVVYLEQEENPRSLYFDNSLLRSLLGADFTFTPLEEGLAREYMHMKNLYESMHGKSR